MPKAKIKFTCLECGYETGKWLGKCPDCGAFNSFVEEKDFDTSKSKNVSKKILDIDCAKPVNLDEITVTKEDSLLTGMKEVDRVLEMESSKDH